LATNLFHRAAIGRADGCGIFVAVVVSPNSEGQADLFEVVDALYPQRSFIGLGQRRQEQGHKDGDGGNDHQQFNQGETAPLSASGAKIDDFDFCESGMREPDWKRVSLGFHNYLRR
jgi:hypothetical protein